MQTKKLGAIFIIAGTSIGVGMLALPIDTFHLGFIKSSLLLIWIWSVMLGAALLMLEATLSQPENTNLASITHNVLGNKGRYIYLTLYVGLLYTLNAAYINSTYSLIQPLTPNWINPKLFYLIILFGLALTLTRGNKKIIQLNQLLMFGLIITYLLVVTILSPNIKFNLLNQTGNNAILTTLPIIIVSFGYQIVIPSIRNYCNSNIKDIKSSIIIGSTIPLITYLIWQACTLGVTDNSTLQLITTNSNPAIELSNHLSKAMATNFLSKATNYFAGIAIVTSFLGVSLSLFDFIKDAITFQKNSIIYVIITFLPSAICGLYFPNIFLNALTYGGVLVGLLLGILPAAIVFKLRKTSQSKWQLPYANFWITWVTTGVTLTILGSIL